MKTALKKQVEEEKTTTIAASGDDATGLVPKAGEDLVGDFDASDISFPRLQIAQGVGPLSDSHNKGDIVLDGEAVIGGPKMDPVEFTVLRIAKMYEENVPFGGDEVPRLVETKAQVLALGGDTEWGFNGEQPSWKPIADALVCLKGGDDKSAFPYEYKKSNYAFALWKIKGVAYRRAAVPIFTASTMYYRDGLRSGSFNLITEKAVFSGNTVFCPKVTRGSRHDKAFVEWLRDFS